MRQLTNDEIKFCKVTGVTATVFQCDEWARTIWGHKPTLQEVTDVCIQNGIDGQLNACDFYHVLQEKICTSNEDAISIEDLGIYLFRTFLTRAEMEALLVAEPVYKEGNYIIDAAAQWLKNWKYYFGFRKIDCAKYILYRALDPNIKLVTDEDGDIFYIDEEVEDL